jgi:Flp pilus assembly protein TadD
MQAGQFDESGAEFREALRIDPDAAEVRGMFGYVLWRLGRPREAERELRQASRALPRESAIHANLGNALQALGRLDDAVAEYTLALQFEPGPSRAEILNDLGIAYAKLGRMDEAVSKFREAVRLNPSLSSAQANLAKSSGAWRILIPDPPRTVRGQISFPLNMTRGKPTSHPTNRHPAHMTTARTRPGYAKIRVLRDASPEIGSKMEARDIF